MALHETLPSDGENDADADGQGGIVAIWNYSTHLYSQRVDSSGVVLWNTTGVPVCTTMNTNDYQQVCADYFGGALITWYGNPIPAGGHIYVQRVYADGTPGGVTGYNGIQLPLRHISLNAYPNPTKGRMTISYTIDKPVNAEITIYNIAGQKVKTVFSQMQNPGLYAVKWDGKDQKNVEVSSGVYVCRLQAGSQMATKKIVLIK